MRSTSKAVGLALAVSAMLVVARASAAEPDQVHVVTRSWGAVISDWTIKADGSGRVSVARQRSKAFNDFILETTELRPAPLRYAQVIALLRRTDPYWDREVPCGQLMTDQAYAEARWRRKGVEHRLDLNYGCQSAKADKVADQLEAAQALVLKWAREARRAAP